MITKTRGLALLKVRRHPVLFSLLMAGAALLSPGWSVQPCAAAYSSTQGPLPNDESTTSYGAFQVQVAPNFTNLFWPKTATDYFYPGFDPATGLLTSPVGYDAGTKIGVSKNETYGFPNTLFPVTSFPVSVGLGGGLLSPPLNQIGAMNEYFAVPNDFAFPPLVPSPDEVFSEIESFTLSVSSSAFALCGDQRVPGSPVSFDLLTAGPHNDTVRYGPYPQFVPPTPPPNLRSIGMVQQYYLAGDYPGKSFFNIFVNAYLPSVTGTFTDNTFSGSPGNLPLPPWPAGGTYPYTAFGMAQLTNDWQDPLLIGDTNVLALPPYVIYIHGQTPAVPVHFKYNNGAYWNAGDLFGYLTLAGHGVLTNCSGTSDGQPNSNCCQTLTMLMDAIYGPPGSPKPGMPVPWNRSSNQFPTPNTSLHTLQNSLVDQNGNTNDLSDTAQYQFNVSTRAAISGVTLGPLTNNPIPPPGAHLAATYNNTKLGIAFNISFNGPPVYSCTGTGSCTMTISNSALPSATLLYANPPSGLTNFPIRLTSLSGRCSSPLVGAFFIRVDPSSNNPSLGEETIRQTAGGYNVSFYDDACFQLSTDNINWFSAISNRTMRLYTSIPAPTKLAPTLPSLNISQWNITNIIVNWGVPGTLLSATTLTGSGVWTPVTPTNTVGSYTNSVTAGPRYFRLKLN